MSGGMPEKCRECRSDCGSQILFLSRLADEKKESLLESTVCGTIPKDGCLFRENDRVDAIYYIRSGKVKLSSVDSEGREQITGIFADHDIIWEGVFMEGSRYPYSAFGVTEVEYCKISQSTLEEMMKDPMVAIRIIGMLSRKLHDANERNRILNSTVPSAKLAGFLLYRARYSEEEEITLRLDDIAASIHLRPETVSRKIREMEREGLLERVGKSGIRILDREGMQKIFIGEDVY